MVALSLIVVMAKRLLVFCVLALAAWHIGASLTSGVSHGKVLVYVSEQPSLLTVDRQRYSITPEMSHPLVCELSPGRHMLRLERNGKTIYEEAFVVEARREQTIFAPGRTASYSRPVVASPEPPVAPPWRTVVPVQRTAYRDKESGGVHPVAAGN